VTNSGKPEFGRGEGAHRNRCAVIDTHCETALLVERTWGKAHPPVHDRQIPRPDGHESM